MKYSVGILFVFMAGLAAAQTDTSKSKYGSYYFDGDEVVFEFDRRVYEKAIRASDSTAVDFSDLPVLEVAVTGNFNRWSEAGWRMQRIDEFHFRLRKKLEDFTDAPNWQFKFLINGMYWASPESAIKKKGILGWNDLKNPNAPAPEPVDTGNVLFRLEGFTESKKVILTGTFNNWDEERLQMKPAGGGWELRLQLLPGVYEYKFIADGKWTEDPANPEKRRNQYDTFNSVLRVSKPIRFELHGYDDAREVALAGSFNDWSQHALKMRRTEAGWAAEIPLTGGKHLYKFIIDGNWITDPANPRVETDLKGNANSVIFVR